MYAKSTDTKKERAVERIASGISGLYQSHGRSCSYRGWVAVGRLELVNAGKDLLCREAKEAHELIPEIPEKSHETKA